MIPARRLTIDIMKLAFTVAFTGTLVPAVLAQSTWQPRGGIAPPPRYITAMAHDAVRGLTVLFGGRDRTTLYGDTWEWNGVTWQQRQPLVSPVPRQGHAMVFDVRRQRVVLVGGLNLGRVDTWEWDGTIWQQVPTAMAPSARDQFAMAYDQGRSRIVLFSGPGMPNDTWEYDGTTWVLRQPATSPPARCCAAMAYDAVRQRVVMFGGYATALRDDTWEWDGTNWTERVPVHRPPVRCCNTMVFDALRGRIVMFGGGADVATNDRSDVWEWDGSDWLERLPATTPTARRSFGFAFETARGRALLFGGGVGGGGSPVLADTWEYVSGLGAAVLRLGTGCAGSAGTPALAARAGQLPWLGTSFTLDLTSLPPGNATFGILGQSKTTWGAIQLPLALDVIGMTGCLLWVSLDVALPLQNQGGRAAWALAVPNDPSLQGAQLWFQGGVLDPAANPFGLTTSNAADVTFAIR